MAILIECPHCGRRPHGEFWFGGELLPPVRPGAEEDREADFARVWHRRNVAGAQEERWYHWAGCRRWLTLTRDTRTNAFHAGA